MGAARGSLPSPALSPFSAGRRNHCIPRGSWCWDPQPSPRRVWWSSLEAKCQEVAGVTTLWACRWLFVPSASTRVPPLSPRVPCALSPDWSPAHARAPRIPALCWRQLVPRCSPVTLEHKQLCSSSPVNYIMSNEQDQAEGIKP